MVLGTMSRVAPLKVNHKFIRVLFGRISNSRSRTGLTCHVVIRAHYQTVTNVRRQDDKAAAVSVSVEPYINSAVCQPRSAERKHTDASIHHSDLKTKSESPVGRHDRVDHRGISTANSKAKVYMAKLYINSEVHQPRSAKRKHIRRSCTSTAISNANPLRYSRGRKRT